MAHAALLVLVLAITAHQGYAIKCYNCNSKTNTECANPSMMGDLKPVECTPNIQWSAKSMNDVLPSGMTKLFDSIGSSIGSIANSLPVEMVCMKNTIKSGDETIIMRNCAAAIQSSDNAAKESAVCEGVRKAADGKSEFCGICDSDGCNSAPAVRSLGLILAAPIAALLYKFA